LIICYKYTNILFSHKFKTAKTAFSHKFKMPFYPFSHKFEKFQNDYACSTDILRIGVSDSKRNKNMHSIKLKEKGIKRVILYKLYMQVVA
jgi:hypothetical protein